MKLQVMVGEQDISAFLQPPRFTAFIRWGTDESRDNPVDGVLPLGLDTLPTTAPNADGTTSHTFTNLIPPPKQWPHVPCDPRTTPELRAAYTPWWHEQQAWLARFRQGRAARAKWWRALPRRDKAWLRRQGVTGKGRA